VKAWLSSLALFGLGVCAGIVIVLGIDRRAPAPSADQPAIVAETSTPRAAGLVIRIETDPNAAADDDPANEIVASRDAAPPPQVQGEAVPPTAQTHGPAAAAALLEVQIKPRVAHLVPVPPPDPGTRPRGQGADGSLGQLPPRAAAPPSDGATAKPVSGRPDMNGAAQAIDGETLELGGQRIRLFGIGAPGLRQECLRADGGRWRCGEQARAGLAQLLPAGATVRCSPKAEDERGQIMAVCFDKQGVDLAARQVIGGLALARRGISLDYVDHEAIAQTARRGMWQGDFERPWEWKRNNPGS